MSANKTSIIKFCIQQRVVQNMVFILLVSISTFSSANNTNASTNETYQFDIPRQPLESALVNFSLQSGVNVIALSKLFNGLLSQSLKGEMSTTQALNTILSDSGLTYSFIGVGSISISKAEPGLLESGQLGSVDVEPALEEIIVSGAKRKSDLQKTPIAISYFSQEDVEQGGIHDLRNISGIVPGLEFTSTGPQSSVLVQLRGVGSTNITEIADGPVSIHIDGVYSPRSQAVAALLHDIQGIEVLRGPQGTLFGRNSSAGSVNIYNNEPSFEKNFAEIELGVGNFNQQSFRIVSNWRASDQLAFRFSGISQKHDPYTRLLDNYLGLGVHYPQAESELGDFNRGLDLGQKGLDDEDRFSWRLSAAWRPTDTFNITVSYENYSDRSSGISELDPTLVDQGIRAVVLDTQPFVDLDNGVLRAKFDYQFKNNITLSYVYGDATLRRQQLHDTDFGRTGDFEVERTASSEFNFYSHELHLRNDDEARLRWIAGLFASRESNSIAFVVDQQNVGGSRVVNSILSWISGEPGAGASFAVQPQRRSDSLGFYSQFTYDLNPHARFTLGARVNRDTKSDRGGRAINCRAPSSFGPYVAPNSLGDTVPDESLIYADPNVQLAIDEGRFFDGGTNIGIGSQPCWVRQVNDINRSWNNTSALLRLDADVASDLLFYGSISTGFKAGHIQDAGNVADPETVISYEVGLKSMLFNDTVRINGSLFQADYDDLQFSNDDRLDTNRDGIPDSGGSTVVRNASKAKIRGLELEAQWQASPFDFVYSTLTLLDARFIDFDTPDSLFGDLFNPFSDPEANLVTDNVNLSGNSPPRTPKWKWLLGYQRLLKLTRGDLTFNATATVSDEYFLSIFNRDTLDAGIFPGLPNGGERLGIQEAHALYDLSLHYRHSSSRWSISAYVNNLTDESVKLNSGDFITENGFTANYFAPRTYGMTMKFSL